MVRRSALALGLAVSIASCSNDDVSNPFASQTRPASADAVLMFVSGSFARDTEFRGRELMATNADGSSVERLTSCTQLEEPCDLVQVAVSRDPNRIALIRTTLDAAPGASALYFVDLSRSAQKLIFERKRVTSVDWAADDSYLLYVSPDAQGGLEDLFLCAPNGSDDQPLTSTATTRERAARADPFGRTVVYDAIDESGVGHVYFYGNPPELLTPGPGRGEALAGTPWVVGADADPVFSPDGDTVAFRRLRTTGNGGLGDWDIVVLDADGETTVVTGPGHRSAPDWGSAGLVFVETDAATARSALVVVQPDGSGRRVILTEDARFGMASPRWISRTTATGAAAAGD